MTEPRRIVLTDGSEITLAVMQPLLTESGFDVRAVSSLHTFIDAVIDPKPSTADLCTWLRTQVETANTPAISCSSASDEELAEVVHTVGANGHVSKQAGPEALPAKLHALCEEILF